MQRAGAAQLAQPHVAATHSTPNAAGPVAGAGLCMAVAYLELAALHVLVRQAAVHGAASYQALVRTTLGHFAADAVACTIVLYLFGSLVAFTIIAGDTTATLLRHVPAAAGTALSAAARSRATAILLPSALITLPLSLQRTLGALASASTAAVAIMAFTVACVLLRAVQAAAHGEGAEHGARSRWLPPVCACCCAPLAGRVSAESAPPAVA